MKRHNLLLAVVAVSMLPGCATPQPVAATGETGPWTNIYAGNPNLAGVSIEQYPEGGRSVELYEHRHPASIWFVFWDGDVKEFRYSPDGRVIDRSTLYDVFKPGSDLWGSVDFSYGSDPGFIKHRDPRSGAGGPDVEAGSNESAGGAGGADDSPAAGQ